MAKVPQKPAEIFTEIIASFKKALGDEVQSIALYGSGASEEYRPGKSDLNFLVIVTERGMANIARFHGEVKGWQKKGVAIPLIMTRSFLEKVRDVYPVEFLTMRRHHVQVFGEDVLQSLAIDRDSLVLQVKREIKGKIINLQQGYIGSQGDWKALRELIISSFIAFLSLFQAILHFQNKEIPTGRRQTIHDACMIMGVNEDVFLKCLEVKEEGGKHKDIEVLFKKYMEEAEKINYFVDRL